MSFGVSVRLRNRKTQVWVLVTQWDCVASAPPSPQHERGSASFPSSPQEIPKDHSPHFPEMRWGNMGFVHPWSGPAIIFGFPEVRYSRWHFLILIPREGGGIYCMWMDLIKIHVKQGSSMIYQNGALSWKEWQAWDYKRASWPLPTWIRENHINNIKNQV